jgi:hypothetical protein
MKIDTQTMIALVGIIGGVIVGYGQLTGQISAMELRIDHLELMAEKAFNIYTGSQ